MAVFSGFLPGEISSFVGVIFRLSCPKAGACAPRLRRVAVAVGCGGG
ncbi:MAG: hypothetical protein WCH43_11735 [Verrucomicrobiota bacterium]